MPNVTSGTIYRRSQAGFWYIQFSIDGKLQRESSGTTSRPEAEGLLRKRLEEARSGRFVEWEKRPTFEDLERLLLENYEFKRNKTDPRRFVKNLAATFAGMKAEDITAQKIREYSRKRLKVDRMTPATLRRELAILKRMLRLGSDVLPRVPVVDLPRVDNARQGFFEEEDLQQILPHLAPHIRFLIEFLYLTGWHTSEALSVVWTDIDWKQRFVRLRDSKNREPRIFAFKYHERLERVLKDQRALVSEWERRNGVLCAAVFHWQGERIQKLRRSWTSACRRAGMPGRLVHDFRRTAVRNLIRAGVQQAIAMKITGHKTDSIFRRYLIVDEELLAQATGAVADYLDEVKRDLDRNRPDGGPKPFDPKKN